MHKNRRSLLLLLTGLLAISLLTLALSHTATRLAVLGNLGWSVPIATVQQAVDAQGVTVVLEGVVGDRVPLVNAQVYELQDASGRIWVVTQDTHIQTGTTVRIRGKLRFESIPLAGKEQGELYVEQE